MLQGHWKFTPNTLLQLCPNPWPNDFKKNVKIKTYREETSKKIPHLDDVVCHAVQTETRHGSLLALHPNAEVQLSTQTFHRPVTASWQKTTIFGYIPI